MLKFEVPRIAELRVVDLLGTVRKNVGSSVRIHHFARLVGMVDALPQEGLTFYIHGIDCLRQATGGRCI